MIRSEQVMKTLKMALVHHLYIKLILLHKKGKQRELSIYGYLDDVTDNYIVLKGEKYSFKDWLITQAKMQARAL